VLGVWHWPALLDKTIIDTGWNAAGGAIGIASGACSGGTAASDTSDIVEVVDVTGANITCKNPKPGQHGIG
jgi:hypothetical protein